MKPNIGLLEKNIKCSDELLFPLLEKNNEFIYATFLLVYLPKRSHKIWRVRKEKVKFRVPSDVSNSWVFMILLNEMRNQFFLEHSEISQNRWYLWLVICCHQLDKVVSWNILYIAIVQNNTRNMSQFFCWNEMFYQEIRQMSKLPPKSRWWGMGPMKRITTIWLESRKSIFAKKRNHCNV